MAKVRSTHASAHSLQYLFAGRGCAHTGYDGMLERLMPEIRRLSGVDLPTHHAVTMPKVNVSYWDSADVPV